MALPWVERETFQVLQLTSSFRLSLPLPGLLVFIVHSVSMSGRDQCQVSLEGQSLSVKCWSFTQINV